jgi:hypothetical protein
VVDHHRVRELGLPRQLLFEKGMERQLGIVLEEHAGAREREIPRLEDEPALELLRECESRLPLRERSHAHDGRPRQKDGDRGDDPANA